MAPAENPAFWPLTLIVFLPALVAAVLSLPIFPKAREEIIRWITLCNHSYCFPAVVVGCCSTVLWHCSGAGPVCSWTARNAGCCKTSLD